MTKACRYLVVANGRALGEIVAIGSYDDPGALNAIKEDAGRVILVPVEWVEYRRRVELERGTE